MKVSASAMVTSAVHPFSRITLENSIAPQVASRVQHHDLTIFQERRARPGNIGMSRGRYHHVDYLRLLQGLLHV